MKKVVLSLSGGLDSTSLLLHLLAHDYEVRAISYDYGQKHKVELERVKVNIEYLQKKGLQVSHQVINLVDVFSDSKSALTSSTEVPTGHYEQKSMSLTVVENRNMIFGSIILGKALCWANETGEEVKVSLAIHSGDHAIYPDCRPESREAVEHAFKVSNDNSHLVNYYTPYLEGNKTSILEDALLSCGILNLSSNYIFRNTNTCYNPNTFGQSCGKCGSCIERIEAFMNIHVEDPIDYVEDWLEVREYAKKILSKQ